MNLDLKLLMLKLKSNSMSGKLQEIIEKITKHEKVINKLRQKEKELLERNVRKKIMQENQKSYLKLVGYFKSARFKKQQIKANKGGINEHI